MTGTLMKTISHDKDGNQLFRDSRYITFNPSGSKMFVSDWYNGVVCFDGAGNYLSTIRDGELRCAHGVCVDGTGNVFVAGRWSNNVIQYTERGEKVGVVVKEGDGVEYPWSVCYHPGRKMLFVTMFESNIMKMFHLE